MMNHIRAAIFLHNKKLLPISFKIVHSLAKVLMLKNNL